MKKLPLIAFVILVATVSLFVLYAYPKTAPMTSQTSQQNSSTSIAIRHVVIILEENESAATIIGNPAAPYINKLANTYAQATNYHAISHPSLPNYLALTSGTTAGIHNDCNPPSNSCRADVTNIADLLEATGRTWKTYAESMPSACYPYNSGQYAVRHNPFMYYPDITKNKSHCQDHVVPLTQLTHDLNGQLPNYSFIIPNLCSDMHDCSIRTGDNWLAKLVPKILHSDTFTKQRSLLIVVWDEGSSTDNRVPAIFAGSAARRHYQSNSRYTHYSLLHTIENIWNLKPLTQNDKNATTMVRMLSLPD